jgi:hypothetical protein
MDELRQSESHGSKRSSWPAGPVALRLALVVALLGLLAGLFLLQASEIAVTARRVEILRQKRDDLRHENADLLDQIAVEGSIPRLQDRATKLGLEPARQVEYLSVTAIPPDSAPTLRGQWTKNDETGR